MPSDEQAQHDTNRAGRPRAEADSARPHGVRQTLSVKQAPVSRLPPELRADAAPPRPVRIVRSSPTDSAGQTQTRRRAGVYVKHALVHPWHVVVLAGATVFGVANWSVLVLLLVFAGAELVLLGVVLRMRSFRMYVDDRLDQIERNRAAEQRATLLLQMADEHRRELLRLEAIVDRIRDATGPRGAGSLIAVDECLHLLANYVRLAIAHNVSRDCLSSVSRRGLEDDIHTLEAARFVQGPHARALSQRRVGIARKRAERWDRSREALDAIGQQLAMISELVQLTHEQAAAPADPAGTMGEFDRAIEELDESRTTLDEITEFLAEDEAIDPRILDMGRAMRG